MRHDFIDRYSRLESPVHALDPRAKIVALFVLIVACVLTPPTDWWAFTMYAALAVIIAYFSRLPVKYMLSRLLIILPFVLVVAAFLPFMHKGGVSYELGPVSISGDGLLMLWNIAIKALISVSCLILLSSTTPFADLMHGFERLKVPRFFTTVASFMYRYVFLIVDEAERMKRARDSRNFRGRWLWHAKVIGFMIASLFLRSQERAERVYQAMVARGFDGTFPRMREPKMRAADYIFMITVTMAALSGRLVVIWT